MAANRAPTGFILSGVPLVRQTFNACGPASLTEVLAYYGISIELSTMSRLTRRTERSYMTAQAILDVAPTFGLEAQLYSGGSIQTIRQAIRVGLPLIALQNQPLASGQTVAHWRVVIGYDDASRTVYVMDPLLGYIAIPQQDFLTMWTPQRGQFAVMYPPTWRTTVRQALMG